VAGRGRTGGARTLPGDEAAGHRQVTAALTAGHSYTLTLTNHDDNYPGDASYTYIDDVALS
jgi:hypothetical protein